MKKASTDKCIALLFWAEWHPPCHWLKDQMCELAKIYKEIKFTWVDIFILKPLIYSVIVMRHRT